MALVYQMLRVQACIPVPGSASFDINYLLALPIDPIMGMSLDLARQAFWIGLDHIYLVYHEQDIFLLEQTFLCDFLEGRELRKC